MKTSKFYYIYNKKFKTDGRYKEEEINLQGGGMQDIQSKGFEPVDCFVEEYDDRGFLFNEREDVVYKKDDKFFERTNFMHFNGHFSGYEEGVYEVYFRQIKPA